MFSEENLGRKIHHIEWEMWPVFGGQTGPALIFFLQESRLLFSCVRWSRISVKEAALKPEFWPKKGQTPLFPSKSGGKPHLWQELHYFENNLWVRAPLGPPLRWVYNSLLLDKAGLSLCGGVKPFVPPKSKARLFYKTARFSRNVCISQFNKECLKMQIQDFGWGTAAPNWDF